jgi:hypothetical protein
MKKDLGDIYQSVLCAIQALRGIESQYCDKHGDCDDISSAIHCIADALDSNTRSLEDMVNVSLDVNNAIEKDNVHSAIPYRDIQSK